MKQETPTAFCDLGDHGARAAARLGKQQGLRRGDPGKEQPSTPHSASHQAGPERPSPTPHLWVTEPTFLGLNINKTRSGVRSNFFPSY